MNRYVGLLLITIAALDAAPFDDAPSSNYIELQDMSPNATRTLSLPNDQYSSAAYHPLGGSTCQTPDDDLNATTPSRSTIQRRIFNHTLPEQGFLLLLRACLTCCSQPDTPPPYIESDVL